MMAKGESDRWVFIRELDRLGAAIGKLDDRMNDLHGEIRALEVRAGVWSVVAGLVPAIGVAILWLLQRGLR